MNDTEEITSDCGSAEAWLRDFGKGHELKKGAPLPDEVINLLKALVAELENLAEYDVERGVDNEGYWEDTGFGGVLMNHAKVIIRKYRVQPHYHVCMNIPGCLPNTPAETFWSKDEADGFAEMLQEELDSQSMEVVDVWECNELDCEPEDEEDE